MEKNTSFGKVLSIVNFLLILIILAIILIMPTATSYEISIYWAFPSYFWFLVIISIFLGIMIIIRSYLNEEEYNNWIFGFIAILFVNSILLLLPIFRNYFIFGRGDVLSHIGYMINILKTGHIFGDQYPMIHILGLNTFFSSGIDLNQIPAILPFLFTIFYIVSFYLLFKQILVNKKDILIGMVVSSLLLYSTTTTVSSPFNASFFLIPFFLYCYFSSRKSERKAEFSILTLIMASFITFFHPLTTLTLIIALSVIEISSHILLKTKPKLKNKLHTRSPINIIIIMLAIFFTWQTYAYLLIHSISNIFSGIGESQLEIYSSTVAYGNPTIFSMITTFFNNYGQWFIVTIVSIATIFYLIKNRHKLKFIELFSSLMFIVFLIWSLITFSFQYNFGFGRTYIWAIFGATFLLFIFFKSLFSAKNNIIINKYFKFSLISMILLPLIYFSLFNLYYSPITQSANPQVAQSEYIGMQTFFEDRDNNFKIYELGLSHYRFNQVLYGIYDLQVSRLIKVDRKNLRYSSTKPIDHFGYSNYTSIKGFYTNSSYLLITDLGRETYPKIYSQYKDKWRFTPSDFIMLNNDSGLSLIYDNSNLNIYLL